MPKYKLKKSIDIQIDKAGVFFLPSGSELDLEEVEEAKVWEPKPGEQIWWIAGDGEALLSTFTTAPTDKKIYRYGNCFRTEEEALKAGDAIKELLKGMRK